MIDKLSAYAVMSFGGFLGVGLQGPATAVAVLGGGAIFRLIKLWRYDPFDELRRIDQITSKTLTVQFCEAP